MTIDEIQNNPNIVIKSKITYSKMTPINLKLIRLKIESLLHINILYRVKQSNR